jgi:hypothetical protein
MSRNESKRAAIFNLDGCVSDDRWRRSMVPHDAEKAVDFAEYHARCYEDEPMAYGAAILANHIANGDFIVFLSGRPGQVGEESVKWIAEKFKLKPGDDFTLFLRGDKDERPTVNIKSDFVDFLMKSGNKTIVAAYDNRRDVVLMYREKGIEATILNEDGEFIPSECIGRIGKPDENGESEISVPQSISEKIAKSNIQPEPPTEFDYTVHKHPTSADLKVSAGTVAGECRKAAESFEEAIKNAHEAVINELPPVRKHSHYFKPCPYQEIDVYRVLELFDVTDQAIGHAIKKLLVAGGRGGGKSIVKDIGEAIDTLKRWQEMRQEEDVFEVLR